MFIIIIIYLYERVGHRSSFARQRVWMRQISTVDVPNDQRDLCQTRFAFILSRYRYHLYLLLHLILTARTRLLLVFVFYLPIIHSSLYLAATGRGTHTLPRVQKWLLILSVGRCTHTCYDIQWYYTYKRIVVVTLTTGKWCTAFVSTLLLFLLSSVDLQGESSWRRQKGQHVSARPTLRRRSTENAPGR